ncbi:MAG TPA: ABC transporter ATP-binding protein [Mycobacteriales bacterium]|nr:ABC transporter ATP-binding protein [Mycobacteriales bacterium]
MTLSTMDADTSGLRAVAQVRRGAFTLDAEVTAARGEVVALLGPNGAGKSTMLRVLAGLLPVDTGEVVLDGAPLDDPARGVFVPAAARPVGLVFQDYLLFPHLSVRQNVEFAPRAQGASRAQARALADPLLARFGLTELAGRRPGTLSGGQAQRVALARTLAAAPRLLLLDEPLAALDASTRLAVRAELREHLSSYGGPALVVTHDPVEAMVLADRLVVVEAGRVVQDGAATEIARRPRTEYVARLMGLNLYRGTAGGGTVDLDGGGRLVVADAEAAGRVLVALRPAAVSLHTDQPRQASPRNAWAGTVSTVEPMGDRVRVTIAAVPPVRADVTPLAVAELGLRPGRPVWTAVKATELDVYPAG